MGPLVDAEGKHTRVNLPSGVAVDASGIVYVADEGNNTIRKITADGAVSTLAGLAGSRGSTDGTGSVARFDSPSGVAVDSLGNDDLREFHEGDTYNPIDPATLPDRLRACGFTTVDVATNEYAWKAVARS